MKPRNFVSKHMNQVNRSVTMIDRKKAAKAGSRKHKQSFGE